MSDTTLPLELDLPGRVGNMRLAPSNALYALYEAVVNAIHAVLDGPEPAKSIIRIRVLRGTRQRNTSGTLDPGPVIGFEISDNGIGFDEKNFNSFRRSDSTTKAKYGGKGVGRLLWLKVFNDVRIASVFEDGKKRCERVFTFSMNGIGALSLSDTTGQRGTIVTLKSPVAYYRDALQHEAETIAIHTIEHCLEYFIGEKKPKVYLIDDDADYNVELGALFSNELKSEIKRNDFSINGSKFRITHLLLRGRKNSTHSLHFCAHSRRVKDEGLGDRIPGLTGGLRLPDHAEDLAYHGYVSGALLDQWVSVERTGFHFDGLFAYDSNKPPEGTVSDKALLEEAVTNARKFLDPILKPILEANRVRIVKQVETTYPQYRHLLKHRSEEVTAIPAGVDGRDLDLALYKIEQRFDADSREALNRELAVKDPDEAPDARRDRLNTLLEQLNDAGMSKLARHVAYRRAVIEFLEDQFGLQDDGKYSREDAVHSAVCPMRVSSDDVPAASMNLWLLDDRLYFHHYLASDMPMSDMKETVRQEGADRPDLAIFHRTMAFSDSLDEINAVVLVEFKKPLRDDFQADKPEKNPVSQVLKYVKKLKDGEGRAARGQAIHIREHTPFYAYIVADLTPSLCEVAERDDFIPTPDGDGYFKFHTRANCYIEIVSFGKMIRDAKKRNQAFFDKLNIPIH